MARLSVTVDPSLVEEARRLARTRTKREAIERALTEFVRTRRLVRLAELEGSGLIEFDAEDLRLWRQTSTLDD